jgi:hypothetical protein
LGSRLSIEICTRVRPARFNRSIQRRVKA